MSFSTSMDLSQILLWRVYCLNIVYQFKYTAIWTYLKQQTAYIMNGNLICTYALLYFSFLAALCKSYKILLIPYMVDNNSRLMNMLKMANFLQEDGHDVSVLLHTREKHLLTNPNVKLQEVKIPDDMQLTSIDMGANPEFFSDMKLEELVQFLTDLEIPICECTLQNKMHIQLKKENFDLIIIDVINTCLKILVDYIDTNVIQYSNYGFTSDTDLFYPHIPSLACGSELGAICSMQRSTFLNRLKNVLLTFGAVKWWIRKPLVVNYQKLRMKYNVNTSLHLSNFNKKKIVIATIDFALDSPRPLMPHVIPISGLFRTKPNPLAEDLEQFMRSSGDDGVVLVSFGGGLGVNNLPRAEALINALSKLKQKVGNVLLSNSFKLYIHGSFKVVLNSSYVVHPADTDFVSD